MCFSFDVYRTASYLFIFFNLIVPEAYSSTPSVFCSLSCDHRLGFLAMSECENNNNSQQQQHGVELTLPCILLSPEAVVHLEQQQQLPVHSREQHGDLGRVLLDVPADHALLGLDVLAVQALHPRAPGVA